MQSELPRRLLGKTGQEVTLLGGEVCCAPMGGTRSRRQPKAWLTRARRRARVKLKFIFHLADRAMKTISMLEFRLHAEKIIAQVQRGQRLILTRRGKPVARLEPIVHQSSDADDPFYSLSGMCAASGETLSNTQIDDLLYGQ